MTDNFDLLISRYVKSGKFHYPKSDNDTSNALAKQITERDISYTRLLKDYIKLTKVRWIFKEVHKWLFFWLMIAAGILSVVCICHVVGKVLSVEQVNYIIDAIPVLIAALVSLVSTIIAIPLTVAQFLFNTKEDDNITSLIQHTQDHDSMGISVLKEWILGKDYHDDDTKSM